MEQNTDKFNISQFGTIVTILKGRKWISETKTSVETYLLTCLVSKNLENLTSRSKVTLSLEEWINKLGKAFIIAELAQFINELEAYPATHSLYSFFKEQKNLSVEFFRKLRVSQKSLSNLKNFSAEVLENDTLISKTDSIRIGKLIQGTSLPADTLPVKSRSRSRSKPSAANIGDNTPVKQEHKSKPRGSQIGLRNHRP